uniref:Glycosyltransferase 2-like domain-containing protein n=1 Tax=Alexandrium catenella TaxID=2925 RepID=A0A7S1M5N3_ALECA
MAHYGEMVVDTSFVEPVPILAAGDSAAAVPVVSVNTTTPPSGAAIWSKNQTWVNITRWHPAGLVSNINHGHIKWNDVSYMSLRALLMLSAVCWPALMIAIVMFFTIALGLCISVKPPDESLEAAGSNQQGLGRAPPVLRMDQLTNVSRRLYIIWKWFCAGIPCLFVFGLPIVLIFLSRPYPQEVFSMLSLITGMMMFSNGIWVVIFGGSSIIRMHRSMMTSYGSMLRRGDRSEEPQPDAIHWVFLPQYKEDVETVAMSLRSIAQSTIAKKSIGIVLGMEQRETEAPNKAETLRNDFQDQFHDMIVTFHPQDLPNDPPGKASNVAWCFKRLQEHLERKRLWAEEHNNEQIDLQDPKEKSKDTDAPVILTIADADSEFHSEYFEGLSHLYFEADQDRRDVLIWQAPVFHVKNYHRQPYPIIVGTMFTCMQELAALSDPHSIRFPYSTYSMSLNLAASVGGWDPEWIAEDWHMGIKCFLLTMGRSRVEPLLLPCANYTPEDVTWWKTILARWAQAKRHALGFSDMAYYFMMLPLVFGHALSKEANSKNAGRIHAMRQVWYMIFSGLTLVVRLCNVHVIIGVLMTYGALGLALKFAMVLLFADERHVDFLFDKMHFNVAILTFSSLSCMVVTTALFNAIYVLLKPRMEGEGFKWLTLHWFYSLVAFAVFGPIYFLGLGIAVWKAAVSMLVKTSFEYEVAAKPTSEKRMS